MGSPPTHTPTPALPGCGRVPVTSPVWGVIASYGRVLCHKDIVNNSTMESTLHNQGSVATCYDNVHETRIGEDRSLSCPRSHGGSNEWSMLLCRLPPCLIRQTDKATLSQKGTRSKNDTLTEIHTLKKTKRKTSFEKDTLYQKDVRLRAKDTP